MLQRFQFGNFRSFRDVQTLSWVPSSLRHPNREVPSPALPVCAIYGANASGKSNVLAALNFFTSVIRDSFRQWEPNQVIPRSPFAGTTTDHSSFALDFLLDDTEYHYGFTADNGAIKEEWLWAFPQGRKQEWFRRDTSGSFHFGPKLRGHNKVIEDVTRPNSLFLSAAAQYNHEQLLPIYLKLTEQIAFRANLVPKRLAGIAEFIQDADQKAALIRLLQTAELGISDINVQNSDSILRVASIRLVHQVEGQAVEFPNEFESEGTKTFLAQLPAILMALGSGGTLAIDEIDRSLHSILCIALIRLFMRRDTNPKSAQLLFTTHDSSLLSSGDLRRDEVWFTEKRDDGASVLYPLTDYSPRNQENLERGYLQGRYGAIPFLNQDQFLLAVAKDKDEEVA